MGGQKLTKLLLFTTNTSRTTRAKRLLSLETPRRRRPRRRLNCPLSSILALCINDSPSNYDTHFLYCQSAAASGRRKSFALSVSGGAISTFGFSVSIGAAGFSYISLIIEVVRHGGMNTSIMYS